MRFQVQIGIATAAMRHYTGHNYASFNALLVRSNQAFSCYVNTGQGGSWES